MLARTLSRPASTLRPAALLRASSLPGALVLAAAVPLLFLHREHQPGVTIHTGSASIDIQLSDLAVLAVALAALAAGLRRGFAPLRAGLPVFAAAAALLVWILAATFYPLLTGDGYRAGVHLVTAAKYAEYALLALALPLLVRRPGDLRLLAGVVTAWSVAATAVALIQFFGVHVAGGWGPGRRQPSFLGPHDLAALSGAALVLALAALSRDRAGHGGRALAWVAGVSGAVGLVLSGSTAAAGGLVAAAAAAALVAWRRSALTWPRLGGLAATGAAVALGIAVLRGGDLASFVHFVGVGEHPAQTKQGDVQTYSQRTLLAYIGLRIFLDHPAIGVGWQGSSEQYAYGPQLPAAHRRFPAQPALAFPSPQHPWGIQIAYLQALADLGVVGFLLYAATLLAGLWLAVRAALRGPPGSAATGLTAAGWLLLAMGVWAALGLVAGVPALALQWLALGLAATAAAEVARGA